VSKIELGRDYCVAQPDAVDPAWMIGLNTTPVAPNFINSWIRATDPAHRLPEHVPNKQRMRNGRSI
jgi:hypothetical protein